MKLDAMVAGTGAGRSRHTSSVPLVSLVVAWQGCPSDLTLRLDAWTHWIGNGVDVVAVCACPEAEAEELARAHPELRIVNARGVRELSALRQLGVGAALGDIVVICDDTIGLVSSWRDYLPSTLRQPVAPGTGVQWTGYSAAPTAAREPSLQ